MAEDEHSLEQGDIARYLQRSRVAHDLLAEIEKPETRASEHATFPVIIELNNDYPGGARAARIHVLREYLRTAGSGAEREVIDLVDFPEAHALIAAIDARPPRRWASPRPRLQFAESDKIDIRKSAFTDSYLFGQLASQTILNLAFEDGGDSPDKGRKTRLIFKLWLDVECRGMIEASVRTVKCDAAQVAFGALGKGVVWAVADTGIDGDHPHFKTHQTLDPPNGLQHCDFTATDKNASAEDLSRSALVDTDGHGSHVAGIIAGEAVLSPDPDNPVKAITVTKTERKEDDGDLSYKEYPNRIAGLAPLAKLVSLKVLAARDKGSVSSALAAVGYVQRANEYGRNLRIHGLNMSLGYPFDPKIYAAGQSPLCRDVDRLVKSGVVVVIAAGNGGYGRVSLNSGAQVVAAHGSTITDPGNAELAITVGATHRDRPHEFGVSYFSAKGPTADGRLKPDLVAPGERIVSCTLAPPDGPQGAAHYREDSGTSMAAPHVSAAIAAFLSCRAEFIGKPEQVKALFMRTATSLNRQPEFQGAGLVDVMRALQAV